MSHVTFSEQAMIALFALLKQEGKFPIVSPNKRVYYFPEARLKVKIIIKYLLALLLIKNLIFIL